MSEEYDFVKAGHLIAELHIRKHPDCEWFCKHTSKTNLGENFTSIDDLMEQIKEIKNELLSSKQR